MEKLEGRGQPIRKQPWITLTMKGRRKKKKSAPKEGLVRKGKWDVSVVEGWRFAFISQEEES